MSGRERLAIVLYRVLWIVVAPLVAFYLLWRARRQPAYRQWWGQRFLGRYAEPAAAPCIWVHAVSVGETRAAVPLVRALQRRHPTTRILVTHMTPTGLDAARDVFGDSVSHALLAYDLPFAVARFIRHWRPLLGVVMETEIWPGLMREAYDRAVPMVLANARMSERSMRSAMRWPALMRPSIRAFSRVLAQTDDDARRVAQIAMERDDAARYVVTGNMKFDVDVADAQRALGVRFRERIGLRRAVVLCASTRDTEEEAIFAAWSNARADHASALPLLVVVPRHPQRFDDVVAAATRAGLATQRRSDDRTVDQGTSVWIGDSMGELLAYYLAADVAYVGGSLVPLGGQNLIEPAAVGCPVLVGPHTFNFTEAANDALQAGAALRVADFDAMIDAALGLVADPARRERMGLAGIAFADAHRGATARTVAQIEGLLDGRDERS